MKWYEVWFKLFTGTAGVSPASRDSAGYSGIRISSFSRVAGGTPAVPVKSLDCLLLRIPSLYRAR
jgi:hypothetical protein